MTDREPPRHAVDLLERVLGDNDPLVGDLVEEFRVRQSSWWFWRQAVAMLIGSFGKAREIRPLRLVDDASRFHGTGLRLASAGPPRHVNLSGSPVPGIGALGLVALGTLVTVVNPHLWWFVLSGVVAGVFFGLALVAIRRRTSPWSPGRGRLAIVLLLLAASSAHAQQSAQPRLAVPIDPIPAIIDAFQSHSVVAITDAHGNEQAQAFLISLVRDRRFTDTVNDIVVEFGSARYQDVMDRFVRGEDVPYDTLRKVWQDATQATAGNDAPINEEFFRAVRTANASLPPASQLRVLLGDPPIEWERVQAKAEHRTWIEMREWYPAAVIQLEVLAKGRRALLVYGNGHLQRRNVMSNYEMTDRRTHSVVSLLEYSTGTRVFVIWRIGGGSSIQPDIASWLAPRLAIVRGTVLGAADFAEYSPGPRFAIRNGEVVPLPQSEWRVVRAEEQIDAVLYLGPQSSYTESKLSRALCADQAYMDMRLKRIELAGLPASEADALKRHCASIVK